MIINRQDNWAIYGKRVIELLLFILTRVGSDKNVEFCSSVCFGSAAWSRCVNFDGGLGRKIYGRRLG